MNNQSFLPLRQQHLLFWGLALLAGKLLTGTLGAAAEPDGYRETLRPLFERHCFDCHSSKATEVKGKLKLDTWEDTLKGGSRGPVLVPADVADSLLLRAIRYEEGDLQMPPRGKLKDAEIKALEDWVRQWRG